MTSRPLRPAALLLAVALLGACAREPLPASPGPAPSPALAGAASAPPSARTPEEVVQDPASQLRDVRVTRTDDGFAVEAWWSCLGPGCHRDRAIVVLRPGEPPSYERWTQRRWYGDRDDVSGVHAGPFNDLLAAPAVSLAPGVRAVVAGGDGATLLPFQGAARSYDAGATWEVFDVPRVHDELAYVSGQVVLPDGRLLVLLDRWSGDQTHRPSGRHHGLWTSRASDWADLAPREPVFRPALRPSPDGRSSVTSLNASPDAGGVLWVRTWDERLYVSVDDAGTFQEVAAR